jgi:hypothetical protein
LPNLKGRAQCLHGTVQDLERRSFSSGKECSAAEKLSSTCMSCSFSITRGQEEPELESRRFQLRLELRASGSGLCSLGGNDTGTSTEALDERPPAATARKLVGLPSCSHSLWPRTKCEPQTRFDDVSYQTAPSLTCSHCTTKKDADNLAFSTVVLQQSSSKFGVSLCSLSQCPECPRRSRLSRISELNLGAGPMAAASASPL